MPLPIDPVTQFLRSIKAYFSPALPSPKRSSESSLQRALRHLRVPQPWLKNGKICATSIQIHPAAAASDPWHEIQRQMNDNSQAPW